MNFKQVREHNDLLDAMSNMIATIADLQARVKKLEAKSAPKSRSRKVKPAIEGDES